MTCYIILDSSTQQYLDTDTSDAAWTSYVHWLHAVAIVRRMPGWSDHHATDSHPAKRLQAGSVWEPLWKQVWTPKGPGSFLARCFWCRIMRFLCIVLRRDVSAKLVCWWKAKQRQGGYEDDPRWGVPDLIETVGQEQTKGKIIIIIIRHYMWECWKDLLHQQTFGGCVAHTLFTIPQ